MKEKGMKILFSILILASVLMPFSVYADTPTVSDVLNLQVQHVSDYPINSVVTQNNISYRRFISYYEVTLTSTHDIYGYINRDYSFEVPTVGTSVGTISCSGTLQFVFAGTSSSKRVVSVTRSLRVDTSEQAINADNVSNVTSSFSAYAGNISSDPMDYSQILNDIYNEMLDQGLSLDDIESNLSDIIDNQIVQNDYLDILTQMKEWSFPIESFPFVSSFLNYNKNYLTDYYIQYNSYRFPIFNLPSSGMIYPISSNTDDFYMILFIADGQAYNLNNIKNQIIDFGTLSVDEFTYWGNTRVWQNGQTGYFVKFTIHVSGSTTFNIRTKKAVQIIPIYFNRTSIKYISSEFALQFGLDNELLNNIKIIAQGTQQSQQAGEDLEDATSDMQSDFNSYYSIENTANSDFNSALNGINFNDQIAGNQSFLDSASFVKTVFSSMMQIPILSTFVIILCIVLMARIFL